MLTSAHSSSMPPLEPVDTILPGLPQSPCQAPTALAHHTLSSQ